MGQTENPEYDGSDQRAGIGNRQKLLTRTPFRPHAGGCVRRGGRFLFLSRLNCVAALLSLLVLGLHPVAGQSQQASYVLFQSQLTTPAGQDRDSTCKVVYLGIVGGTEPSNN